MATTAVEIWDKFEEFQSFDEYDVPASVDGRRSLISASCSIYNKYMRIIDEKDVTFDKTTDELDGTLDDARLEIFAKCMLVKISRDIYSDFVSAYGMNQTIMGFKDFKSQAEHKLTLIKEIILDIEQIRFSIMETTE